MGFKEADSSDQVDVVVDAFGPAQFGPLASSARCTTPARRVSGTEYRLDDVVNDVSRSPRDAILWAETTAHDAPVASPTTIRLLR